MHLKRNITILLFFLIIISLGLFYKIKPNIIFEDGVKDKEIIKEEKRVRELNLTIVGDLLFESSYYKVRENGENENLYFSKVKNYFEDDDISIGNMEVVIGNNNMQISGDGYNFCAPEYIGKTVSSLDFEILSTANNHSYDRRNEGINSTIDYFKNNTDIITIGTEKNKEDKKTRIIEKNGIKVGFVSYTYGTNIKPSEDDLNLINYYKDPYTKEIYKEKIEKEIKELKEDTDIIITIIHWGTEFTFNENKEQKEMAQYLNSLGVDIIVGSHSHSIQPIEIIGDEKKTLVYYSMGNFVSADDDIARTKKGEETYDNAYQFGLLSKVKLLLDENNSITFEQIKTIPIINYFDKNMKNFTLIPFSEYSEEYEKNHYRYNFGLTKEFISTNFETVINEKYR